MRRLLTLALVAALTGGACGAQDSDGATPVFTAESDQTPVPEGYRDVTVPPGTQLQMTLTRSLSSDANAAGDRVTAELTRPLSVDGHEVLAAGTRLEGRVTEVLDGYEVKGRAMIAFRFTRLQTRGQEYDVQIAPLSQPPPLATAGDAATRAVRLVHGTDVTSELTAPLTVRIHVD